MYFAVTDIEKLKMYCRESEVPYFSDEELQFWLDENNGDVNLAAYNCLILKSQDTTLSISGLNAADSSSYFKRLASKFKPNNSGILK